MYYNYYMFHLLTLNTALLYPVPIPVPDASPPVPKYVLDGIDHVLLSAGMLSTI